MRARREDLLLATRELSHPLLMLMKAKRQFSPLSAKPDRQHYAMTPRVCMICTVACGQRIPVLSFAIPVRLTRRSLVARRADYYGMRSGNASAHLTTTFENGRSEKPLVIPGNVT